MATPAQPPDQPVRPVSCAACEGTEVNPHCPGLPCCPWSVCQDPACGRISGFVLGRLRSIANLYPGQKR